MNEISKETVYDIYVTQGLSRSQAALRLGIPEWKLQKLLIKYGIKGNRKNINNHIRSSRLDQYLFTKKDIEDLYITQNLTRDQVAQELGISVAVLKGFLQRFNIRKSQNDRIDNAQQTLLRKYGSVSPLYAYGAKEKKQQTCIKKYGVSYPGGDFTWPPEKAALFADKERFRNQILTYPEFQRTPKFLAEQFHCSSATFLRYVHGYHFEDIVTISAFRSLYEDELIQFIQNLGIMEIEPNNRTIIAPYEIDIYLPELKIGIEFNGDYWHRENKLNNTKYHQQKSLKAEQNGIFLYQIFEYEWVRKKEEILNQLQNLLQKNTNRIFARNCEIKMVNSKDKNKFLSMNHVQGSDISQIAIGLYYQDSLVSLMTFCAPRFSKNLGCEWELSRFCSIAHYTIVGGASRIFKYFIQNYTGDVVSYSDIGKTTGEIYNILGFQLHHISEPNYVWVHPDGNIKTRYQTQMKNEKQIMISQNYSQVFDCGNKCGFSTIQTNK